MQGTSQGGRFPQSFDASEAAEARRSEGLAIACRELADATDKESVSAAVVRLSLGICSADTARLVDASSDRGAFVLARQDRESTSGESAHPCAEGQVHPVVEAYLRTLVQPRAPSCGEDDPAARLGPFGDGAVAVVSIARRAPLRLFIVLEQAAGRTFTRRELGELEVFAFMSAVAFARAELNGETQAAEAALAGAVADAVLALEGIIRALSPAAGAVIAHRAKDATETPPAVLLTPATSRHGRAAGHPRARYHIHDLIGESPLIRAVRETAHRVADLNLPVLITGETGTGKEILAQAIHNASGRAAEPFVGVNVSAIPGELLESELFGYEEGAFTGASAQGRAGKFELARNGTLLLDEIGELPLDMQTKLLRVLQEKVVHRLGGSAAKAFNARVIASTNRDLEIEVAAGRFRLDLLHRLRVVDIQLPPLRERAGDIRLLVEAQLAAERKRSWRTIRIAPEVLAAFERYPWPGNVRELVNTLEGNIALLPPGKSELDTIPDPIERALRLLTPSGGFSLESAERRACARALEKAQGNVAAAAQILGIVKGTLYSKIRRYGLAHEKTEPGPARPAATGTH
ncbi:MAG TPA: sigma 54-interacting transcriptional regulator [Myxococcales bacterium]